MNIQTLIINELGKAIKKELDKHNIVDHQSDATSDKPLSDFLLIIGGLTLPNSSKKASIIIFSDSRSVVKVGNYNQIKKVLTINLQSILPKNVLQELIKEYFDNNCRNIIKLVNKVLDHFSEELEAPDFSEEFIRFFLKIQDVLEKTNNRSKEFVSSQIPGYVSQYNSFKEEEKKFLDQLFGNQKEVIKENILRLFSEAEEIFDKFSESVISFYKIGNRKTKPQVNFKKVFETKYGDTIIVKLTPDIGRKTKIGTFLDNTINLYYPVDKNRRAKNGWFDYLDGNSELYFIKELKSIFVHEYTHYRQGKNSSSSYMTKYPSNRLKKKLIPSGNPGLEDVHYNPEEREAILTTYLFGMRERLNKEYNGGLNLESIIDYLNKQIIEVINGVSKKNREYIRNLFELKKSYVRSFFRKCANEYLSKKSKQ